MVVEVVAAGGGANRGRLRAGARASGRTGRDGVSDGRGTVGNAKDGVEEVVGGKGAGEAEGKLAEATVDASEQTLEKLEMVPRASATLPML